MNALAEAIARLAAAIEEAVITGMGEEPS